MVAQRSCGFFIFGHFENQSCGPEQAVVGNPTLSKELDQMISRDGLQHP